MRDTISILEHTSMAAAAMLRDIHIKPEPSLNSVTSWCIYIPQTNLDVKFIQSSAAVEVTGPERGSSWLDKA
jgi:hypothetical protein